MRLALNRQDQEVHMKSGFGGFGRLSRVSLAAVLLVSLLLPFAMSASAQQSGPIVVSTTVSPEAQRASLAFWSHSALAAAKPFPMPMQTGPATVDTGAAPNAGVTGPASFSAPGAAAADASQVSMAAYAGDWAALKAAPENAVAAVQPEGTSQTYTTYTVNNYTGLWTIYPNKWIGRLSFRTTGGTSYCSATAISGNNFVTAAHCVYDTTNNVWYSNWVFSPAYRNGSAPYGTFAASVCTILTAWVNLSGSFSINGWTRYDVAVCTVGTNTAGQTLNGAVGFAGRQWNYGYIRDYHDLGYPWNNFQNIAIADAGKYLRLCTAESFQQTTDTLGMGCNWGPGISGGPWMTGFAPNVVSGWVNSVNSGLFVGTQNLYGIRFTSNNIVPVCTARGC